MTRTVTLAGYAVVAAAMVVAEVAGRRHRRMATVGAVLRLALRTPAVRWALVAGWLWFGWHVFVRAHRG